MKGIFVTLLKRIKDKSNINLFRKIAFLILQRLSNRMEKANISARSIVRRFTAYDKIIVREMWSGRIGEFVPSASYACKEALDNPDTCFIYFLDDYERLNHGVYDSLLQQNIIRIVPAEQRLSWARAAVLTSKALFEGERFRDRYTSVIESSFTKNLFVLSDKQKNRCENIAASMGLKYPFVCISNRDRVYMNSVFGYGSDFRNSKFETRELAIRYLIDNGIQPVRMGAMVEDSRMDAPYIRYAEDYFDEYMDLFLNERCKFFIGDTSGVNTLASAYGKPTVSLNCIIPVVNGYGGMPQTKMDILIFKKYYDPSQNRFLNLEEMIDVQFKKPYDGGYSIVSQGIEFVDNTSEEVLDVVKEMNERLNGTYVDNEEDLQRQMLYWSILEKSLKRFNINRCEAYRGRIGSAFLRNNSYLFDGIKC